MPATTPDSPSPRRDSTARCIPDVDACWPRVQVRSAQIASDRSSDCARAVIQLGGLTPADVRVELMPVEPSIADAAPPPERRMFSTHAHDNGCFVFEVPLSLRDTAVHEWTIHVHPREALDEPGVAYHFPTRA